MKYINISGYDRFNERENPTKIFVEHLKENLEYYNSVLEPYNCKIVNLKIFKVDKNYIDSNLDEFYQHSADNSDNFILHFGASSFIDSFTLETTAQNRLVDPKNQIDMKIYENKPYYLYSSIDLKRISKKIEVNLSDDAGKYYCNYIYFSSLNILKKAQIAFIHLPYDKDLEYLISNFLDFIINL